MENMIETFTSKQFGEVRITLINNEPWFFATDVCKALEIAQTYTESVGGSFRVSVDGDQFSAIVELPKY